MDKFLVNELKSEGFQFTKFKSIHLFIMVPTDYEMAMWGDFADCRQLEKDEWDKYLSGNMTKSCNENDISAYHWKQKSKDNELVEEFAQLIKMEHKTTNVDLISIYCAIVIVLGALGSALCGWILLILKLLVCLVKVIF